MADYAKLEEGRPWPPPPDPADKLADWASRCNALAAEIRAALPTGVETHGDRAAPASTGDNAARPDEQQHGEDYDPADLFFLSHKAGRATFLPSSFPICSKHSGEPAIETN